MLAVLWMFGVSHLVTLRAEAAVLGAPPVTLVTLAPLRALTGTIIKTLLMGQLMTYREI
ncbi:hypothetical protein DPMN_109361 [Dreissena polymorpha]|uniref:Uncharacterized protein n=1 Tax=Dreissena polymorpha TaxID=45954 RepID=A0A9D4KAW3_DREPO|nr:hypothetical protein DPMN_109361 [Dreissena polymorpha]